MELKKILIFILISALTTSSFAQTLNEYEYIKLEINNELGFDIDFEENYKVNDFNVESYFFTQTFQDSQYLNSFESTHTNYNIINDSAILHLKYSYDDSTLKSKNSISNRFIIESTEYKPKITSKQIYPISQDQLNQINSSYLSFSEFIDTDDDIKKQASKLAEGEDDIYIIASKIAKWIIENVEYDLNTVFENPNQKSSEVFDSKEGVCREITNLYISMLRSVGIPARVAIGYSYTESEELVDFVGSNWGGHAWAEVLIGDKWVPFDLTYNQYGYVDSTHIITDKYHEIRPRSISVKGSGYGFDITPNSLTSETKFTVIDKKNISQKPGFEMKITGPDELGFGSYGYLKIDMENLEDYYQLSFLRFSMPKEVEILDMTEKMLVFMPGEKKETYFRFKIPNNLDPKLIYTFPFSVYNEYSKETYEIEVKEEHMAIRQLALPEEEEKNIQYSNNMISADCNFILQPKNNLVLCSLKNPNNFEANNIEVCFDYQCKTIDIKVGSFESVSFETQKTKGNLSYNSEHGSKQFFIEAELPRLEVLITQYNETFQTEINTHITNPVDGINLIYYINKTKINKTSAETQNQIIINHSAGIHPIRIDLTLGNETIDSYNAEIFFKEKSILERFIKWFLSLITI